MNPVETVIVKNQVVSESETVRVASINRFPLRSRVYELTQASEDRLMRAVHGRYSSRYGVSENGWLAHIRITDDQLCSHYRSL